MEYAQFFAICLSIVRADKDMIIAVANFCLVPLTLESVKVKSICVTLRVGAAADFVCDKPSQLSLLLST
jgi:hypothetical protein